MRTLAVAGLIAFAVSQPVETCDQCGPDGNSEHVWGGERVWLVRPDGSGARRVPCTGRAGVCKDRDPSFAPDGRRLAIVGARGLAVLSPGGRELLRVDPFPGWSPSWGPGGRRLGYVISDLQWDGTGPRGIALTDLAGHTRVIQRARVSRVAWSSRGRLAWTVFRWLKRSALWVGDAAGGTGRRIALGAERLSWSPDGSRIAYAGARGLFVIDADGDRRRRLTRACRTSPDREGGVAWSPDGRAIACSGRSGSLVVLDLRTMSLRKVVPYDALRPGSVDGISWQPAPRRAEPAPRG